MVACHRYRDRESQQARRGGTSKLVTVKRRPNSHWRPDGKPKAQLLEAEADRRAARYGTDYYRCEECGMWHLGGSISPKLKEAS